MSVPASKLICGSPGPLAWKPLTKVNQFLPFTLKLYRKSPEMVESWMFTCQRTNVYAVRIPTSRSVPTSKSSAYEGTDSWNKDVLGWPRVGTLHSPAPGNQATGSLSHPLQNRHVTNYPTPTLIWLLSAPYTWEGHHLTGKRGRAEEPPALGHRSTQFSNLQSPRTHKDLSPAL